MREQNEDTYFLDRNMALQIASQRNIIALTTGEEVMQHCYYDGDPFDDPPDNLINVPAEEFSDFFMKTDLRLPTNIYTDNRIDSENIVQAFSQAINEIANYRKTRLVDIGPHFNDTYFLDREAAYKVAIQNNRVKLDHPTIDGLQICYHDGEPFPDAPKNLISIPSADLLDFLVNTRLRLPKSIVLSSDVPEEQAQEVSTSFNDLMTEVQRQRSVIEKQLLQACRQQKPDFSSCPPYRIFLMASRLTTVMQYASRNLAKALEKLGHKAIVSIEQDDMEELCPAWNLKEFLELNPHLIISINHPNNTFLHPELFNIVWWQDPMPEMLKRESMPWRERDIVFSAYREFDPYLEDCAAPQIHRQGFCVDTDVFYRMPDIQRSEKIIFIGSSYRNRLSDCPGEKQVLSELIDLFNKGEAITKTYVDELAERVNMPVLSIWHHYLNYVVRDMSVRWICQQNIVDVEVYGRGWEHDEVVRQYYKGELEHGEAVAKKYNEAKYCLISLPQEVNSQRLSEAAACGCIPVIYDSRHTAEPPFWEDQCMYFRTRDELYQNLTKVPQCAPDIIAETFSYDAFAKCIIETIEKRLNCATNVAAKQIANQQ